MEDDDFPSNIVAVTTIRYGTGLYASTTCTKSTILGDVVWTILVAAGPETMPDAERYRSERTWKTMRSSSSSSTAADEIMHPLRVPPPSSFWPASCSCALAAWPSEEKLWWVVRSMWFREQERKKREGNKKQRARERREPHETVRVSTDSRENPRLLARRILTRIRGKVRGTLRKETPPFRDAFQACHPPSAPKQHPPAIIDYR